jgi:hypothetical protein
MKIVTYDEFIRLPSGSVFCPYTPCYFHSPFQIKVDKGKEYQYGYIFNGTMPLEPWFSVEDEFPDCVGNYETEMVVTDNSSVDFYTDCLFAVLEKHEVERIIDALKWAIGGCKQERDAFE